MRRHAEKRNRHRLGGLCLKTCRYAAHTFGKGLLPVSTQIMKPLDILKRICILLRSHTGHDFSQYKENTLLRRVERRMALHQIERPHEYLHFLQQNSAESEALFRDLLIGVTNFFRDPGAFEALKKKVIPGMFAGRSQEEPVRIWVCGCSTGEEAYSLAILIQEYMENLKETFKVQIFATDIDKYAIEKARNGVFPASIAADVSPERLAQYFSRDSKGDNYKIRKIIRDLIVFSEQDVTKDPPFSKLSMVSCRNLLIYMNGDLQKKLIPLFHYSLNPNGILFLGTSEFTGGFITAFKPIDRKWKIYRRIEDILNTAQPEFKTTIPVFPEAAARSGHFPNERPAKGKLNFRELTEHALLKHCAHAAILINSLSDILYVYGRTGKYLEPAPGDAGVNILLMAREGLRRELTTAVHKVVHYKKPVNSNNLRVRTNGDFINVNLCVLPVRAEPEETDTPELYLVILEEISREDSSLHKKTDIMDDSVTSAEPDGRIVKLEQELKAKEEYLQSALEEAETSNEELKSTNEEMQSVNEELQSTDEELETSKEELQSVNEELATVNAELQTKVADLSRANNDMNNLLAGTGVGTLFVDRNLKISRLTPSATGAINLIQADTGRPIGHIASNLQGYDSLLEDLKSVLDTLLLKLKFRRKKASGILWASGLTALWKT
uniref:protein-glutamate O-methyltransferase n=1 Tax=uncultured Desulfobacterium sp. TaxID=201089 RepID=E1YGD1_9BACT|nr:hypothetical protein N47_J06060 [uncultured Desulfobacterium sp.]